MIRYLVVHCADTPDHRDVTAADIHGWHQKRGWDGIGYHAFIRRDGTIEAGRPVYWTGAHVRGHNSHSLGVCLAGRTHFTEAQRHSLEQVLWAWKKTYPEAQVCGHNDLDPKKSCPNFNAKALWKERFGA
ncbi:MAG: N-acetylmuramoyl-L-alanine amidase [Desulfobacterales bacterium]|nr:N-acetylmuramoyl-L-alanine amidase [Desulfobacterales bacterium]